MSELVLNDLRPIEIRTLRYIDQGFRPGEIANLIHRTPSQTSQIIKQAERKWKFYSEVAAIELETGKHWIGSDNAIPRRNITVLENAGIVFLEDLIEYTEDDLAAMRGIGKVGIAAIRKYLKKG